MAFEPIYRRRRDPLMPTFENRNPRCGRVTAEVDRSAPSRIGHPIARQRRLEPPLGTTQLRDLHRRNRRTSGRGRDDIERVQ